MVARVAGLDRARRSSSSRAGRSAASAARSAGRRRRGPRSRGRRSTTSAERSRMRTIDGIGSVSSRFHTRRRKNSQADHGSSTPAPADSAPPVSMSTRDREPAALPAHHPHRQVVDHAAVDMDLAGVVERRQHAGQRHRGAQPAPQLAGGVGVGIGGREVGGHAVERQDEVLDVDARRRRCAAATSPAGRRTARRRAACSR